MFERLSELIDPNGKAFWRLRPDPLIATVLLLASFVLFALRDSVRSALWFLAGVDLMIHEAGHPVFGVFGIEFIGFLGGTLMQLMMPVAFFLYFLRHSQPKSADAVLFWIGQNLLDVGRYMADARSQDLPLLGGGEHDWAYLLGATGLLKHDRTLGGLADFMGCALLTLSVYGLIIHYREGARKRPGRDA
ncbi:MAG: hypothetical protein HYX75_03410 [Acidobacteria bacterium]|nr:hypothetical protein [Acidobacteriota bacterium]